MAPLTSPHWQAIAPAARSLILDLGTLLSVQPFYLAGGTALALRLGHRLSLDLDLFARVDELTDELRQRIVADISGRHPVRLIQNSPLGLVIEASTQSISFFTYGYPLLEPPDLVEGLRVAGLLDIGLMKLDAIAGRGERKDFYDVYAIARQVPLARLFEHSREKYSHSQGFRMLALAALVDFDKADQQEDATLLLPVDWQTVKGFFRTEVPRLAKQWIGLDE